MYSLEHRVRVFVFQLMGGDIKFLLLRHKPTTEWPLGPVVGTVEPAEQMQRTVLRQVSEETGLRKPVHLIEISQPGKELFGDMGLVEWPFAWQAGLPSDELIEVHPGPNVGEFAWMGFEEAYHQVETEIDRHTIMQLRLDLCA